MTAPRERERRLSQDELQKPFTGDFGDKYPPIVSPQQLADLLGYAVSTIYFWLKQGRFDGAFRKRGKHVRFWRIRALDLFFNGPEWPSTTGESNHEK